MNETCLLYDELLDNKTLCGALTRWGYTCQVIQIRTLLSGKVEYERKRFNTVLKCGRPYK